MRNIGLQLDGLNLLLALCIGVISAFFNKSGQIDVSIHRLIMCVIGSTMCSIKDMSVFALILSTPPF